MPDPIAEAFVSIRPDLSQFESDLQLGINRALRGVQVPAAAQQNLGQQLFGPGFLGAARTSTTQALNQTQVPTTTQQKLAQALFGPGFRNESGRAIQGALVGLGQGQLAARFAFFGAGGAGIAAIAAAFLTSVQAAGTFEQALNELRAVTNATDDDLEKMSDLAKQLGSDINLPAVTAQTAANAMSELAKAGLDVNQVMSAVRGTLQLATAAQIDAASAARIQASALNAFNLAGDQASHVADLLAQASIESQASIQDLSLALQQSAAVANLSGLSLEQLVGALSELANRGLIGSDAGTSLRTALLRLIPTTREAASFMEVLGIQIDRTRTLGAQLPDLLDQYNEALSRLNPTLRQQVLAQIAGQDAVRSLSFLIEGGGDEFRRYTDAVDEAGAAQRLSEARTQGFLGALEGLNSQLQTLAINVGSIFTPALEEIIREVTNAIEPINELFSALQNLDNLGEIDIKINLPDLPDTPDIPFLDKLKGLKPDVDIGRTIINQLSPALGLISNLEAKAKALSAILSALGFGPAADEAAKLSAEAKKLNDELFQGGNTVQRNREIQARLREIEAELRRLSATASTEGKKTKVALQDILDPITGESILAPFQRLEQLMQTAIDPNVLGKRLLAAIQTLQDPALTDDARQAALGLIRSFVAQLADLGPEGERVLTNVGGRLIQAVGDGITREEQRAIDAARSSLAKIRQEGDRQIQEAIRSARGNLESLGSSIGDTLGDIIDLGPVPARIRRQVAQVASNVERGLRFDLTGAKRDLREAEAAIGRVGILTPAQRRAQNEFLGGLRQRVREAQEAVDTFSTEDAVTEIDKLKEKIEELQDLTQRRQLRFDLSQAQIDLREAREAVAGIGTLTPTQRRAQEEFLAPFQEKVKDAKAAVQEFDLSQAEKELEDIRDKAVDAADRGIQQLILKFEDGKVSADDFQRLLRRQLGPAFDIVGTKAAQALDPLVVVNFRREVEVLIEQARELSAFFPLGGATTPGAQVVRPSQTVRDVNQRIAESAASLARIEEDAKRLSKEEQEKLTTIIGIQRQIARALGVGGRSTQPGPTGRGGNG